MTENELGGWRSLDSEELGTHRHATLWADLDGGMHAPDERPPGTARDRTQDTAFLVLSQVPSSLGFHLEFAVNFVMVVMEAQVLDMVVGLIDISNLFTGKVSG